MKSRLLFTFGSLLLGIALLYWHFQQADESTGNPGDRAGKHLRATYDPLHFKPAILSATNEQCLACHREVIDDRVQAASPSGFKTADAKAAYQRVSTYAGDQETFHRRHLVTPLALQLMKLKCNTCHEGHDPREEASPVLRKQVNPETTCLKCHGQMPWQKMKGLNGPWPVSRHENQNNCLSCHAQTRTQRHKVDYLNAAAIETAGKADSEVCYGCHGGRAWYQIAYNYAKP